MDTNHRILALKVQKKTENGPSELQKEFNIYRTLLQQNGYGTNTHGIPSVQTFKEHMGLEYMFMERLGESLQEIKFKSPSRKLNKSDVLMVGIQCVRRLRNLHEDGILHRDIKPSNLVMGIGPRKGKMVHVIDFGISSIVDNWDSYNYEKEVRFVGTLQYASPDALFRKAPSRKGDLMSLAYTLLSLASGDLPWKYVNTQRERFLTEIELGIQRIRSAMKAKELFEGFPELTNFFKTISRTKPASEPQYDRLIELLEEALEEMGLQNDGNFIWLEATFATTYATSPCTEYDLNSNKEVSETSYEACTPIKDGEEHVWAQGNTKISRAVFVTD